MIKHELELAVLKRRVEALEADARLNKHFRDYATKQFTERHADQPFHVRTISEGKHLEGSK